MTEMLLVWLVAPVTLFILCFGLGLFPAVIMKRHSTVPVIAASGFLLLIVLGSLMTARTVTVPYTSGVIAGLSGAGLIYGLGFRRSYIKLEVLPLVGGVITYVMFGLPVMAYGKPSWAGWVQLDDTASFLAVTDRIMQAGQSVPAVVTSSFDRIIQVLLGGGGLNYGSVTNTHFVYPVGTFVPFGVLSKLTTLEKAWLFQPYLAFAAALSGMLFVMVLKTQIHRKSYLLFASSISIGASTLFSYVMWGGIKEIVIMVPITLMAMTLFGNWTSKDVRERWVYVLLGSLALYFIGGMASFGFAGVLILVFLLLHFKERNQTLFVAIPTLIVFSLVALWVDYRITGKNIIGDLLVPKIKDSGNLIRPLSLFQMFGIWPSQDFRLDPVFKTATFALITLAIVFAIAGFYFSVRRSIWVIPSLAIAVIAVVLYSNFYGGIWLTGKAIAVASPVMLLCAAVGLFQTWDALNEIQKPVVQKFNARYLILIFAVLIGAGVVVSDAFTYKNVWLAPYPQVNELKTIGTLYAGQGPALMTEYSVFGARYFLRNLDAEAASELRVHPILMSDGTEVPKGFAADISLFDPSTIDYYNILVLRKSPVGSRPPLNYALVWSGNYYEVWKKVPNSPAIKSMLPLGDNNSPGAVPSCQEVTAFLAQRAKSERIFAATRQKVYLVSFSSGDLPVGWVPASGTNGAIDRRGSGGFSRTFSIEQAGLYDLSIAGSFPGQLTLLVDGDLVYSGHSVFEGNPTLTNTLTKVHIAAGSHILTLTYKRPILMPGSDVSYRFGPIFLSSQFAGDTKVEQVSNSRIPQLCSENLDWIAITN